MKNLGGLVILVCLISMIGCATETENAAAEILNTEDFKVFELVSNDKSGISFNNKVVETSEINTISFDGMLQGAGVAVLDINADGLQDVYFAGNMVSDEIYLNKGNLKFENISKKAGLKYDGSWSTGVATVDINADGYDDIYVCKFLHDDASKRKNRLYINNKNGTFTDRAEEWGIADAGYGIMANFFDMDNDGDLDLYLANQPPNSLLGKEQFKGKTDYRFTDRVYKNLGKKFVDVTDTTIGKNYSYSLSATASDLDNDGLTDIYVACDYEEPDFLYMNKGGGSFEDRSKQSFKHISNFSMGADISDINNDGYLDVFSVDMVAEDNFRQKTNMGGMNPKKFWNLVNAGYHHQYMFNALQLNNGNGTFSEIAQMSNVSNSDWSWTPLFMDMDHDGNKDLMVTNGIIKEMRNKDFEIWRKDFMAQKLKEAETSTDKTIYVDPMEIAKQAPSFKIANVVYQNKGDLVFENRNQQWGFEKKGWSQGAAYADFDNDGDQDLIINNMNMVADLYESKAANGIDNNYISIKLEGYAKNTKAINSRIRITTDNGTQILDHTPFRGYMSTSETVTHFGIGTANKVRKIEVDFPGGKKAIKTNVKPNQTVTISYKDATENRTNETIKHLFAEAKMGNIKHTENNFDDYLREILIPYKMSHLGPIVAAGDINADGSEDFYLGGSVGQPGRIFLANETGYTAMPCAALDKDNKHEDGAAAFYDVDNDGDLDLYVGSGGNEYLEPVAYQDRLYINDGSGKLTKSSVLPKIAVSTGAVCFVDYDNDGDSDILVGGRQLPGKYGVPTSSMLLRNDNGQYVDVTAKVAPGFINMGMVTTIVTADLNGDDNQEIIITGEWMPLTIMGYDGNTLAEVENQSLKNTRGMWNTLAIDDIDGDGDLDMVAGNMGLNNKYKATIKEPFKVFVNDFDNNGTHDVYLGYYANDGQCYPVRGRQCSSEQMPFVKEKFDTYSQFATATIDQVLDGKLEGSFSNECQTFAHTLFINNGSGVFKSQELARQSQVSPSYGIVIEDFNGDGMKDIFTAGNFHQREVETTRSDAGIGTLLLQKATGKFEATPPTKTGVIADKDVRGVMWLKNKSGKNTLVIANNNSEAQFYQLN